MHAPHSSLEDLSNDAVENDGESDRDLAHRLSTGSSGALEEVIRLHGEHLHRLIGNLMAWNGEVDDLMQELLLKAWKNASSYRGEAPLRHWLTQIAVRVCRNQHRASRRWFNHLIRFGKLETAKTNGPERTSDDPRWDATQQAMSRLSHSDRELLVLFYIEQQSIESISAQLAASAETMNVRLHRARQRLKKLLEATANG